MNKTEILTLLEQNKDIRGIKHWENAGMPNMSSFGIGVTVLKKLAKQIGKNHEIALALWEEKNFECKTLSTIIDEPKKVTRQQIDKQITDVSFWMLSHAYCNYLLPKVAGIKELSEEWINKTNDLKRRCGFLLLYQISKNNKKLPDSYFLPYIHKIEKNLQKEENFVKDAMNTALWMIGQRSKELNTIVLSAAKTIGKVNVDYGDNSCKAMDITTHLTSERIQKKFLTQKK
jgi:3-methyladenine DNA glycosylase AlkD